MKPVVYVNINWNTNNKDNKLIGTLYIEEKI